MQIHPVIETFEDRYVLDAERGPVRRRETILGHPGSESIVCEDNTYFADADGTFEVPNDVAAIFVGKRTGVISWHEGPSPFGMPAIGSPEVAKAKSK